MTRIANTGGRSYRSALRERQAEETRARILDATLRVIAGGLAFVSIPHVAREAGVSVPTIYRHFATKRDLLAAVYPHAVRSAGLPEMVLPRSMDELRRGMQEHFERTNTLADVAKGAMASPAAEELRRINMPERIAIFRRLADSLVPPPTTADRDRIARLLVVLTSSSAVRMWREHLGSSVEEAAADVDWVLGAAIAAAERDRS